MEIEAKVVNRGNCMLCGRELTEDEGIFFCKECGNKIMDENLCDSCSNVGCVFQSGIVRKKCAFYMPPHIEPDNCGNYIVQKVRDKDE